MHRYASIRPRPFSRGNASYLGNQGRVVKVLQFGHDLSAVETAKSMRIQVNRNSFNSATTFQPWKRSPGMDTPTPVKQLQFGHDLSAVETKVLLVHQWQNL